MEDKNYYFIIACLCFFSGFINIVTLFYFDRPISHFSGTFTSISQYLYNILEYKKLIELLFMVMFFIVGAVISSILSSDSQEKNIKKYGKVMILFGFIILFLEIYEKNNKLFLYFLTLTMGFQNGMSIHFKGSLIRSTHMTGNLTDFGSYLGKFIKGEKDKLEHIFLSFLEIIQYTLGGVVSIIFLYYIKDYVIIIYSFLYIICGLFMNLKKNKS